jgi:hypothetical protein
MIAQIIILDAVQERLKLIRKSFGYTMDVYSIERASLKPFMEDDLPAINYWSTGDVQINKGMGWVDRQMSVVIECYSRTRDRPFTDVVFELANDIAICMMRSPVSPRVTDDPDMTLGGLVRSSQLAEIIPQVGEGQAPWCGAAVNYELIYRVASNDLSTLIPN